ncbi:SusC/RagA family TonB-linked outer membrane protein [Mucilaginibacter sp. BJC16-A38]|uniref:SusC/RagA family TonB-linked outer membrane protein n=1 Tax=Mucilaginibacter phenanthrenivorans TaxID=1234842 RepID=UPI002157A75F|nr:SusC/RagA family TonB-linked outer membrane protein [Mucilaginibacter phenanthrenivorans]MCR8557780.1 SusC/RagA family TonB-linked outer membrane protein [Mucilaginibacter phenanthrenivorans]
MEKYTNYLLPLTLRIMKFTFYMVMVVALGTQLLWASNSAGQILEKTKINIRADNKSLKDILKDIEGKSNIRFTYNEKLIKQYQHLNVNETDQTVASILQGIFDNVDLSYIEKKNKVIIVEKQKPEVQLLDGTENAAATITVKGKVSDDKGEALPGVNVVVKGTTTGTTTSVNGEFALKLVDTTGAKLVFSYLGFEPKEVSLNGRTVINVSLTPSSNGLKEVVVVSYGTQSKREITGAISQIKISEVKDMPVANIGQKLQGKLAGVQINENSGTPGAEMSFRIRGAASINAGNNPLIVIDGFPSQSGLQSLSPDEIESITVLKDASSAALYGSRAANGVILVTTKQAKVGQKSIEFSAYTGVQSVPDRGKPDLMNPEQFAEYKKEYYEDAIKYEGYSGGIPAVYANPSQYAGQKGTNWFDILLRNAVSQNYNLAITSGTTDLKSVVNLNYNKQEGVMLNSYDERFTARSNNIYTASDRLTLGVNLELSYGNNQVVPGLDNGRNIIENAFLMDPTLNYKNADGSYPLSFSQPGMFPNPNYYLVLTQIVNKSKAARVLANGWAEVKIIDGLKFKSAINVNTDNTVNRQFTPSTAQGGLGSAPPNPASGSYNTSNFVTWLSENTLNYKKTIGGKHNFDVLAGYTAQKYSFENSNIDGSQFPDDNIQWINAATTRIGNVGATQWSYLRYIGRFNYNYDQKYLLQVAFARDGSSKFGNNTKYGNFPSVNVGWVVSDEAFMKNIKAINFLKIRASYGKVGNNNIGDYSYLASVNTTNYVFSNQVVPGKVLSGIGNNNLTWETTTGYDLGLDLELFDGRVSFTYDYYKKKTDGLLYGIDIPVQSGFSTITSNIGRFDFWGHEFTVNTRNLTGDLKWNTGFNISFDRNIVKQLGTNNAPIGGYGEYWDDNRTAVGHPIGLFYGYINTGVYMTQAQFDSEPHDATAMVGTARFKDVSGPNGVPDGKIDSYDRTWIGNPNPTFTYGITNSFSYKNLDLSIVMAGSVGNDIADDAFQSTENLDGVFNVRQGVANRWRSEQDPGDGIYPRTRSGTTADFRNFTSRQVFKATYLAVKNITFGYTLPIKKTKYFKSFRAYVSAQNAFIFTKYPGMNPEAGIAGLNGLNQGRDFTGYPIPRVLSLGINAGF